MASRLLKKHKTKVSLQTNRIWVKVFKNGPSKICGRQSLNNDFSSKIEMNKKNELQSLLCHLKTKIWGQTKKLKVEWFKASFFCYKKREK